MVPFSSACLFGKYHVCILGVAIKIGRSAAIWHFHPTLAQTQTRQQLLQQLHMWCQLRLCRSKQYFPNRKNYFLEKVYFCGKTDDKNLKFRKFERQVGLRLPKDKSMTWQLWWLWSCATYMLQDHTVIDQNARQGTLVRCKTCVVCLDRMIRSTSKVPKPPKLCGYL